MLDRFDPRVVPEAALRFVRACAARADCQLAGGAALSGAHLAHRLSGDLDLFCHDREAMRHLVSELRDIAAEVDGTVRVDRDVLAWLLLSFPVHPLPVMLTPLTQEQLRAYRDELAERFRRLAAGA